MRWRERDVGEEHCRKMVQGVQKAKFSKCEEERGGLWAWSTLSEGEIDEVTKGISRAEYVDNFKDGF